MIAALLKRDDDASSLAFTRPADRPGQPLLTQPKKKKAAGVSGGLHRKRTPAGSPTRRRSPSSAHAIDRESLRVDGLFLSISDSQAVRKAFRIARS